MENTIREYFFDKGMLIEHKDAAKDEQFQALFGLANQLAVEIVEGREYACMQHLAFASRMFGVHVHEPFYKGFPDSVRELSCDQLLFDQLVHYTITYGFGYFSQAGASLFDSDFKRAAFREGVTTKKFVIISEEQALEKCREYVCDLMLSSRPLSEQQYKFVMECVKQYKFEIEDCECKDTAVQLLVDLQDMQFADFLEISDVIRMVEYLNWNYYANENVKKLNLKNVHRKFITKVLDYMLSDFAVYWEDCYEKQAIWCGLLHHIHYNPKNEFAVEFVSAMRSGENRSAYSEFEGYMKDGNVLDAVECLSSCKGDGAVMRNINYILSRCKTQDEIKAVLEYCKSNNAIILIQMLLSYENYKSNEPRSFKFTKFNRLRVHTESEEEVAKRKSALSPEVVNLLKDIIGENLKEILANKIEKVYINPEMKNIALPLQETTTMGGYGVLTKGSRVKIPKGKKIRAFTYWEKVNDIDLSIIGLGENGNYQEFSWRTMYAKQSKAVTYSGDQTAGFNGGSEYYDIEIDEFKALYPDIKYLVFCNNVYSFATFNDIVCRAGYMLRDEVDSGEVFEPKTVKSAFTVNCDSTEAYLFAFDLTRNEFIWLNVAKSGSGHVAGMVNHTFLLDYMKMTDVINLYTYFEMLATEVVDCSEDADVVVSDEQEKLKEGALQIRSTDFEKILKFMNE